MYNYGVFHSNKGQEFEEYKGFHIIFVNFHLPLKRKCHICLRFGKQLKPAKEF